MTETQALLGKIAALRQRLEQARGLAEDASSAAALLERPDPAGPLRHKVAAGAASGTLLENTLRRLPGVPQPAEQEGPLPSHLTARACRLLPRVRELLTRLRSLADEPLLSLSADDPMAALRQETTALTELAVRVLQTLPETPSIQLRLCEGVEAVVKAASQRTAALSRAVVERRSEQEQIDTLAGLLDGLARGPSADVGSFVTLANELLAEVAEGKPLRFLHAPPADVARFVACHSLTTARVAVRIARHIPEWHRKTQQAVLAALVHDVGMMRVPAEVLSLPQALDESQRREVERHVPAGTEMLSRVGQDLLWLRDVAAGHHERLDGTGYPAGMGDLQVGPLVRLVAVCDVYAALCCPRPHRPALDTRTALTDTLMLAQQGALDADCAKALLELALYPVGAAVELADGALGVVIATHQGRKELGSCDRPVVALLTDGQGRALPSPLPVDLAECTGRSIVRSLPAEERRRLLGPAYPEWA